MKILSMTIYVAAFIALTAAQPGYLKKNIEIGRRAYHPPGSAECNDILQGCYSVDSVPSRPLSRRDYHGAGSGACIDNTQGCYTEDSDPSKPLS